MKLYRHAACAALAASALFPTVATAAEPSCKYVEIARVPLRYAGPGLDITMPGSINGRPATMVVDTGAFETLLTRTAAERNNLVLTNSGDLAEGVGGDAWIYHAQVDGYAIGPVREGRATLRVLKDFGARPQFDALVGAPFLLQADLEISLATKELKFFRPHGCGDSFLGYWDERAVVLPFNRLHRTAHAPVVRATANPHFTVVVNGVNMDAIIDSGASSTVISLPAAKRAGLKLDAPGVARTADTVGIGTRKVASWRTVFKRFEIGDEIVYNAEIGVIDYDGAADVLLGADFLRSHRVLFAMSQKKIYLSYIGGEPFDRQNRIEPWIVAEAHAGNPDAQMELARYYLDGRLVARNTELAGRWIEQAALRGNAEANILTGNWLLMNSNYAEAAKRLRAGLDKLPTDQQAALDLYLARVHMGEAVQAKTELAQARAVNRENEWPAPISDFYLGKLGADKLLETAAKDRALAKDRSCESLLAMTDWYFAHGDKAALPALVAQRTSLGCPIVAMTLVQPAPK